MTKGQAAIRALFGATSDSVGNLPPMPGIFPHYPAPMVRNAVDGRELVKARWAMTSSSKALIDATAKRVEAGGQWQAGRSLMLRREQNKRSRLSNC